MSDPTLPARRQYEDLASGEVITLAPTRVSRDMITDFAREFDPFPFHLDEKAARESLLGGLAASGWQTAGLSLRMLVDAFLAGVDSRGGLGFSDLKWRKPVMVDDTISGTVTLSGLRRSESRPDWAIMTLEFDIRNQKNEQVMTMTLNNLVGVRHPGSDTEAAP